MPKFRYTAVDRDGKTVRSEMAAADEHELFEKLKAEKRYLISAKEIVPKRNTRKLKIRVLVDFSRELGAFLGAGVPLLRALATISQSESLKQKDRAVYTELLRQIRQGQVLSDAMESMKDVFPPMMIHMFRASETAGNMGQAANRMADYYTKEHRLNEKVKSSMTYPKFLGILMVAVTAILMGYVLPQFESLFAMMEELPLPTRILYGITGFFSRYWYLAAFLVVVGMVIWSVIRNVDLVRLTLGRLKVQIPFTGEMWKIIYTARFARALSSLYAAGIPMIMAMQISKNSVGNLYIEKQLETAIMIVRAGGTLSEAIENVDGFVRKLDFCILIGEETGSLDVMLDAIADDLEYESIQAVSRMIVYLEPVMIVILAVIVGFIMIAVMMPIYESYMVIESSVYN